MATTMSSKERDIQMMVAAGCHLGTKNLDHRMGRYVYCRRDDGIHIINLDETYEKLKLAARIIVAIENPQDIVANSGRPYGHRAVFKFAQYLGCNSMAGRHTPGTFTNQIQKTFVEPRLLLVTDPRTDAQPIKESSYMSIPTIAFCDTDSPLDYVDMAIPVNNRGRNSIAVAYWVLCRMVLEMRGTVTAETPWDVLPDMFLYSDHEEQEGEGEEGDGVVIDTSAYTGFGAGAANAAFGAPADTGGFDGAGFGFEAVTGFEAAPAPGAEGAATGFGALEPTPVAAETGMWGEGVEEEAPAAPAPEAPAPEAAGGGASGWGAAPTSGAGGW